MTKTIGIGIISMIANAAAYAVTLSNIEITVRVCTALLFFAVGVVTFLTALDRRRKQKRATLADVAGAARDAIDTINGN
jgi:uncharacterized membrane protein